MALLVSLVFLLTWTTAAFTLPHNTYENFLKATKGEPESSGSEPEEPVRGIVKVVQLDPRSFDRAGFFRAGLSAGRGPSLSSGLSFPAFLSRGRPGPAPASEAPAGPLRRLSPQRSTGAELKKRQGLQMWQRAIGKGDPMSVALPVDLKDAKQTCTAVPFTQRITADGCEPATVPNKLCFGQCSSLFVPSEGDARAPCSRCGPSRARSVAVPLRCGAEVRAKRITVVEECRCETGREERAAEAAAGAPAHL